MLGLEEGATIAEVVAAIGWLKERLRLTIVSDKVEGRGRVYRTAG